MAIYMVVVFGGGSMAVFFFTWRGLGINHLAASGVPAFVWDVGEHAGVHPVDDGQLDTAKSEGGSSTRGPQSHHRGRGACWRAVAIQLLAW